MILIVDNQSVYPYSRGEQIADGSVDFVKIEFRPSREWDGYLMHAQFRQGVNVYTVLFDENNSVFLPSEITAGEVEISVFGYAEGRPNRGTSIPYTQIVRQSGFTSESSIPIPPTPDLYTQLLKEIDSAVTRAEDAAEGVNETVRDALQEAKESGEFDGADGADGYSPMVNLERVEGGVKITAVNETEEHSVVVLDGEKGKPGYTPQKGVDYFDGNDGNDGTDGFSPEIKLERTENGVKVTAINKNGEESQTVYDGTDTEFFLVRIGGGNVPDHTEDEILAAVDEEKVCIAVDLKGYVYTYAGKMPLRDNKNVNAATFYSSMMHVGGSADVWCIQIYGSSAKRWWLEDTRLANPYKITFTGAVEAEYDGSHGITVEIPEGGTGGGSGADGEDGGFYTPSVDANGNLSWTASKTDMPSIAGANIKGPKGDAGADGEPGPAGPQGAPGKDGADGYSPTVTLTRVTDGVEIAVQNKDGTQTATVYDGKDGEGGGLPEGGEPHQMLVTDGEGNTKWEARTHYVENKSGVDILPETTLTFASDSDGTAYLTEYCELPVGTECVVVWNGTEYACTALLYDVDGVTGSIVGASGLMGFPGGSTEEPFMIVVLSKEGAASIGIYGIVVNLEGTESATLRIYGDVEIVHKIDRKFLPANLYGMTYGPEEVYLKETTLDTSTGTAYITEPFDKNLSVVGIEYTLVYNGESYVVTAEEDTDGSIFLRGPSDEFGVVWSTPEHAANTGQYGVVFTTVSESSTVCVTGRTKTATLVPKEFLPEESNSNLVNGDGVGSIKSISAGGAVGTNSVAFGEGSFVTGDNSVAMGLGCTASGIQTMAFGFSAKATGGNSNAYGTDVRATGDMSQAFGSFTIAASENQTVMGRSNVEDASGKYLYIIGNGGIIGSARSNAHTLDWDGNGWYAGDLYVGGTKQSEGSKVLTEADIDSIADAVIAKIPSAEGVGF